MADSVSLESLCEKLPPDAPVARTPVRKYVMIFFLFLVVVSDFFANNVLGRLSPKAMSGRMPSTWGVVLQGLCLAVGYALLTTLDDHLQTS